MKIAESNVIGAIVVDSERVAELSTFLKPEMFVDPMLARIYRLYLKGYDNGFIVTVPLVVQYLHDYSQETVLNTIKQCTVELITSAQAKEYAEVIVRDYKAKLLKEQIESINIQAADIDYILGNMITNLEALQDSRTSPIKSLGKITGENCGEYFKDNLKEIITLGFPRLDILLGGLQGGDVIAIGARPGVGKSAFVTQIAAHVASKGKRVGFYNLEMQEKQVYERFVVNASGLSLTRLRRAIAFQNDEEKIFTEANEKLSKIENILIATGTKSITEIRAEVRHMQYDLIIIDYLQLIRGDGSRKNNRYAEVGDISKGIKQIAMELNIPVIVLSQLNRASELTKTKEPSMSEFRESGDIEQDASVVMLMWNLDEGNWKDKGLKVDKNRQGTKETFKLEFDGDHMRFKEKGIYVPTKKEKFTKLPKDEKTPFDE